MLRRVITPVTSMRLPSSIRTSGALPGLGALLLMSQRLEHGLGSAMVTDRRWVKTVLAHVRGVRHSGVLGQREAEHVMSLGLLADGLVHAVDALHDALARARSQVREPAGVGIGGGDERGVGQAAAQAFEQRGEALLEGFDVRLDGEQHVICAADHRNEPGAELERGLQLISNDLGTGGTDDREVPQLHVLAALSKSACRELGPGHVVLARTCAEAVAQRGISPASETHRGTFPRPKPWRWSPSSTRSAHCMRPRV